MSSWLSPEMQAALQPLADWQVVALVLYGEARSEPIEGIVAVGNVIRNRTLAPGWWGKDYVSVSTAPQQFSCLSPVGGEVNYRHVLETAQRLAKGEQVLTSKGKPARQYLACAWTARGIVGGFLPENTLRSTHYHTATLTPRPSWAQDHVPTVQHGGHVFYRLTNG